jgi:hypothetical protein
MMPAPLAGIGALGFDAIPFRLAPAFRATKALAEPDAKKMSQAGFVSRKLAEEVPNRNAGFFLFHTGEYSRNHTVCQGDKSELL